jgi:hypothetical protein
MQEEVVMAKSQLGVACQNIANILKEYDYDVLEKGNGASEALVDAVNKTNKALQLERLRAQVLFECEPSDLIASIDEMGEVVALGKHVIQKALFFFFLCF